MHWRHSNATASLPPRQTDGIDANKSARITASVLKAVDVVEIIGSFT